MPETSTSTSGTGPHGHGRADGGAATRNGLRDRDQVGRLKAISCGHELRDKAPPNLAWPGPGFFRLWPARHRFEERGRRDALTPSTRSRGASPSGPSCGAARRERFACDGSRKCRGASGRVERERSVAVSREEPIGRDRVGCPCAVSGEPKVWAKGSEAAARRSLPGSVRRRPATALPSTRWIPARALGTARREGAHAPRKAAHPQPVGNVRQQRLGHPGREPDRTVGSPARTGRGSLARERHDPLALAAIGAKANEAQALDSAGPRLAERDLDVRRERRAVRIPRIGVRRGAVLPRAS